VVYQAVDIKTQVRYAVKTLSKYNPDGTPLDSRQIDFQTREIRLHYLASAHANVVSMLKIIDDPDCIYVILEYCPEGDLFFNITECGQYVGKDELAKKVFLQVLDAVEHCHSLGIFHRDLKPENILVSDHGETVKLADFGLATAQPTSEDYGCGSTFYMSPECLDHSSKRPYYYCAPNDVWSLGVVLVNLTCGRNPWKQASQEDSTYRAFTRSPGFLKTILPLSDELNDILGRIFTPNPEQRITLPELKARILSCSRFTEAPAMALSTPPASPEATELRPSPRLTIPSRQRHPSSKPNASHPSYLPLDPLTRRRFLCRARPEELPSRGHRIPSQSLLPWSIGQRNPRLRTGLSFCAVCPFLAVWSTGIPTTQTDQREIDDPVGRRTRRSLRPCSMWPPRMDSLPRRHPRCPSTTRGAHHNRTAKHDMSR